MSSVTRSSSFVSSSATPVRLACLLMLGSLTACSTTEGIFSSDKVDYRANARQTAGLDVPPDLTQLARDSRSAPNGGSVSANALQQKSSAPKGNDSGLTATNTVALNAVGELRLERSGDTRWLRSNLSPEQIWPQLREFWQQRGFELTKDAAEVGVMETNWNENRAKLPQDIIRSTIGKVFDGLYSTGERDMFRTRIERTADGKGTEIFISHRGMVEVYTGPQKDNTAWQPRPTDPQLEAELLSRLMLKLGAKEEQAKAAVAAAPVANSGKSAAPTTVIAAGRPLSEVPDAIKVSDGFERAWRRVGQSLDRHGFTVEDRDRKQGLFFLRYSDPNQAGKEEPNFFERLFSGDKAATSTRYRVSVK